MNIAIIDDHFLFGQSLSRTLIHGNAAWNIKVFTKGEDFLATDFDEWKPRIVISDILMKGIDGMETIKQTILRIGVGSTKYILLSAITDVYTVKNAISLGVNAYLVKDCSLEELLEAIASVLQNEEYISHSLKDPLIKHMFAEKQLVFHLSPREKDVLNLLCSGRTPKEIAYDLKLSQHTIHQYHKNIMKKFNVNRTTDMVVFAMQNGLYKTRIA